MSSPLSGKVAIVTGASQGIGRAIAERLARDGAAVVVNYSRGRDAAQQVADGIVARGGRAAPVAADLARPAEIAALFAECVRRFGRPDIFVGNAGVATLLPLAETTEAEFDRVFNVNARGTLFCLKEAAVHLQNGGRVVLMSSSTSLFPPPGAYIYAGSKAVVNTFVEIAAAELAARRITVNAVLPGVTETPMTDRLPAAMKDQIVQETPLGRLGQPGDIADVVAFLASEQARWITGQHLLVNGGAKH